MAAFGRNGPAASESSEILCIDCPVTSDWSGGVGFVCGLKRGIHSVATTPSRGSVQKPDICNLLPGTGDYQTEREIRLRAPTQTEFECSDPSYPPTVSRRRSWPCGWPVL